MVNSQILKHFFKNDNLPKQLSNFFFQKNVSVINPCNTRNEEQLHIQKINAVEYGPTTLCIIPCSFTKFQFLFSTSKTEIDIQYKKPYIFELPHEMLNELRLKILQNKKILIESQNCMGTQPNVQSPPEEMRFWYWCLKATEKQISKFFCPV